MPLNAFPRRPLGSRLEVDEELAIGNQGAHPPMCSSWLEAVPAGLAMRDYGDRRRCSGSNAGGGEPCSGKGTERATQSGEGADGPEVHQRVALLRARQRDWRDNGGDACCSAWGEVRARRANRKVRGRRCCDFKHWPARARRRPPVCMLWRRVIEVGILGDRLDPLPPPFSWKQQSNGHKMAHNSKMKPN